MVVLLLLQVAATLFMTGLIWFVQVVHYPLFAEVGSGRLARYEELHARRTTWVVFPPMVVELLTASVWMYPPFRPAMVAPGRAFLLFVLVLVIWATTGLCHVPLHTRLGQPFSQSPAGLLRRLVRWNWVRTAAWTARALLLLATLWRTL